MPKLWLPAGVRALLARRQGLRGVRRSPDRPRRGWLPTKSNLQGWRKPLRDHSDTATLERLYPRYRRRRRRIRRTIGGFVRNWRIDLFVLVFALGLSCLGAAAKIVTRDWGLDPNKLPTQSAPTLSALNRAITRGESFALSLTESVGNGEDVQKEAPGFPLRAFFPTEGSQGTWVLLGQEAPVCAANGSSCHPASSIGTDTETATSDKYPVSFSSPSTVGALQLRVDIDWAYTKSSFRFVISTTANVREPVQLWLDKTQLIAYQAGDQGFVARTFLNSNRSLLRMNRITVRHATQSGFLYWSTYGSSEKGSPARAAALGKFLYANNYSAGYDLRAPIYGYQVGYLPDDMPADSAAYPDCQHLAASSQFEYPYQSKVCLFVDQYIQSGLRDPFLQAWDALTVLVKYGQPNRALPEQPYQWTQGSTPAQVAHHLQGQFNRDGQGVPKCTPFSCAEDSSIRTSVFGALEAQLGYCHGNIQARRFADAAAAVLIRTQVGLKGLIPADNGVTYIRPTQAGAFIDAWVTGYRFTEPSTPKPVIWAAFFVRDALSLFQRNVHATPLEYRGIIASNSETQYDALAFLQMYKEVKYNHAGCSV